MSTFITISLKTENKMKNHHYQKIKEIGRVIGNTYSFCLHENVLECQTPEDRCDECRQYYPHCYCSNSFINDNELYRSLRPSDFENDDISLRWKYNFMWDDFYNKFGEDYMD